MSLVLHEDPLRGSRLEVPLPLIFEADVPAMAEDLGLPAYLDLADFQVRKAVVTLWAAAHADRLEGSQDGKPYSQQPIPVALFGGMAFRMLCPSANNPDSPFFRPLNDLDLIIPKRYGRSFIALLSELSTRFGTGYGYWITRPDKIYNGFREGRRYRLTTINNVDAEGSPVPGKLDVFTESIGFCHDVDIREELESSSKNHYTLSIGSLILLKSQFIRLAPRSEVDEDDFRLLEPFDDNRVILGMEPKDARDVCAALHDHGGADENSNLLSGKLRNRLARDWGLHRTVRLNLANLERKLDGLLKPFGASEEQVAQVKTHLSRLLELVNEQSPRKPLLKMGKQWWRTVED